MLSWKKNPFTDLEKSDIIECLSKKNCQSNNYRARESALFPKRNLPYRRYFWLFYPKLRSTENVFNKTRTMKQSFNT